MFKRCKENGCLSNEILQFLTRQFQCLKEIAMRCKQVVPEITCDKIMQSVTLMEKKIIFGFEYNSATAFQDFLSDFYEEKIEKLRKQLNKEILKSKQLAVRIEQIQKSNRNKDEWILREKAVDLNSLEQSLTLKSELISCQKLLQSNHELMQEQNRTIDDLNSYISKLQQKETKNRQTMDAKIKQLDQVINIKRNLIYQFDKQVELQRKKMEKDIREIQIFNISLLEEKDQMDGQILMKSQQIKLLSKKIYEQQLIISKFERLINQKQDSLIQQKQEIARFSEENKLLKQRIIILEKDFEKKMLLKSNQIIILQQKIEKIKAANVELQNTKSLSTTLVEKTAYQIRNEKQNACRLQEEVQKTVIKNNQLIKQLKKQQRKEKQLINLTQQLELTISHQEEQIKRLRDEIYKLKKQAENRLIIFEEERKNIKSEIQIEFKQLTKINNDLILALEQKEGDYQYLFKESKQFQKMNVTLRENINQLTQSFENAKNMTNILQKHKEDLDDIRKEQQRKILKYQNILATHQKMIEEANNQRQINQQMNQKINLFQQDIKLKQEMILHLKTSINNDSIERLNSQKQELKKTKEQIYKKQFMIKQLNSKVMILQEQLRESDRTGEIERKKMMEQIRQLEQIIQQRFDLTNQLVDSRSL